MSGEEASALEQVSVRVPPRGIAASGSVDIEVFGCGGEEVYVGHGSSGA
jgi:hypothetical protein